MNGEGVVTFQEILQHIEIDGWCVVEGVIPEAQIGPIRQEIEAVTAAQGVSRTYQGVVSANNILGVLPAFVSHVADPARAGCGGALVRTVRENLFHDHLDHTSGQRPGPLARGLALQSGKAGSHSGALSGLPVQLSSLWMISDFTEENGGTWIVPGSHRASNNPTGDMGILCSSPTGRR